MSQSGTFTIVTIACLTVIQGAMSTINPSPSEYFEGVKNNLTLVRFAHAANSKKDLQNALKSDVHMIEADVVVGYVNDNTEKVPIMAHPPLNKSDLSLENFLTEVTQNNATRKGIKLDFKSIEAFTMSKEILKKHHANFTFPIWLNADILNGPMNVTTAVPATDFIKGSIETIPECTLSLGWTTSINKPQNVTEIKYSKENIEEMLKLVKTNAPNQSVTYAVRAGIVANDTELMKKLIDETGHKATLTVWSSAFDNVDADQLSHLIISVGVDKVYLDVPKKLHDKLHISGSNVIATSSAVVIVSVLFGFIIARLLSK